ncbi:MAG: hypothetical protein ABSA52_04575 [Candidatus Binatia bacterium]
MARGRGTGLGFLDALPEDGERRLMLAVLIDAIRTLTKPPCAIPYLQNRRAWMQERAWMLADDPSQLFSFVSICHALGLEAGYVRRRVLHRVGEARGPARRYAAKAGESWARLAGQRTREAQARPPAICQGARSSEVSRSRRSDSLLLSNHSAHGSPLRAAHPL